MKKTSSCTEETLGSAGQPAAKESEEVAAPARQATEKDDSEEQECCFHILPLPLVVAGYAGGGSRGLGMKNWNLGEHSRLEIFRSHWHRGYHCSCTSR